MSVKNQKESFCTHQSACELSLWSLSYCSSKIDTGKQGGGNCPWDSSHTAIVILPYQSPAAGKVLPTKKFF